MRYVYGVIFVLVVVWVLCVIWHTRNDVTITEKEQPDDD